MSSKKTKQKRAKVADLEAIYQNFAAQPPQLTDEQMREIDARCEGIGNRRSRRLALHVLRLPGTRLIDIAKSRGDALTFAETSLCIDEYAKHLRSLADLMDTASLRLQLSLCNRADMSELFKEAQTLNSSTAVSKNASFLRLVVDNTKDVRP
jgi:hypothetical protein